MKAIILLAIVKIAILAAIAGAIAGFLSVVWALPFPLGMVRAVIIGLTIAGTDILMERFVRRWRSK